MIKSISTLLLAISLVVVPAVFGTPESGTVQAAEAVPYTCGTPRWGYQYHFIDVRSGFYNGREVRYREDYRYYCHPKGYWYKAIYFRGHYYSYGIWA